MPVDWIAALAGTAVSNLLGPRLKEGYDAVRQGIWVARASLPAR